MRHLVLCLTVLVVPVRPAAAGEPLAGRWLLTMAAGFEYGATLEAVEPGLYRLRCGATTLQGLYELKGRRLFMAQPADERMVGLAWEVKNHNALVLTEHPTTSQFGSDYRGATLGRQKQADAARGRKAPIAPGQRRRGR